jgi:hypothetical protein
MAKRTRGTAPTRHVPERSSGIRQFAGQPLVIAGLGVAFGLLLGTLMRLTPEESEFLGEQADRLKEQAGKLKDSVSDIAVEGYAKAVQTTQETIQAASEALSGNGQTHSQNGADQPQSIVTGSGPSSQTVSSKV